MSYMKTLLEDRIYKLADASGYDAETLMAAWNRCCDEAAEDGVDPDWEQFQAAAMECDL